MKNRSISRRLTIMNIAVSVVALLVAGIVFFVYDWVSFRQSIVRNLSIQAEIAGFNSVSALLFNDPGTAERTLAGLRADPAIKSAVIITPDGELFARYDRSGTDTLKVLPPIRSGESESYVFRLNDVTVGRAIQSSGKTIGILYIHGDLQTLNARVIRYVVVSAVVLCFALLAALVMSAISKRAISKPLAHLAGVASTVSRLKDYSLRASTTDSAHELTALVDGFNEMLAQIEERDKALQRGREELERRVRDRTLQLENANKELEAFSYSVSHDLRAPLRHIDGFSSMLSQKYNDSLDATGQRYLTRIRDGARQMGQLIDDLLDMGRITRKEMARTSCDLNELVRVFVTEIAPEAQGRRISWRLEPLPVMHCDPGLMKVVFTNLLSNAVKYTRHKAEAVIEVGARLENGKRVVFVKDNGAGFEQEYVHKLFGVFQRLHRNDEFEGTGVGLATVRRIIDRHGGSIWAEGRVGEGATFFFTLDAG